ncbi:MAG: M12 family metallo-peptidase [Pseudohongiellaceae bacterium]
MGFSSFSIACRNLPIHWLVLLCCGLGSQTLLAQESGPWQFELVDTAAMVTLDPDLLRSLQLGDSFPMQLEADPDSGLFNPLIGSITDHGGDISWSSSLAETGNQHSVVITLGNNTAFVSISSPIGVYQLSAKLMSDGRFRGELQRYSPVRAQLPEEDFVRPLDNAGNPPPADDQVFSIAQTADEAYFSIGDTVRIDLQISNQSSQLQPEVFVDVFFLLENTTLIQAPDFCIKAETQEQEPQPVLSCDLGNMPPGQSLSFDYSIGIETFSHPLVYSTAQVSTSQFTDARSDLILNVYRDVTTDSDGDGISDFNEQLLGSDADQGQSVTGQDTTVIDVMAVHADAVDDFYGDSTTTRLNHLVSVANKIYRDSDVAIRLRVVASLQTDYTAGEDLYTDLSHLTYKTDPAFSGVELIRNASGADVVVLFRTREESEVLCGLANLGGKGTQGDFSADYQREFAYSVINMNCLDDSVLAHELGHNMGLVHSRLEDPEGGTFHYSAGYGVQEQFVSVMAYSGDYDTDNKVFRFSTPDRFCGSVTFPFECGVDHSDAAMGADARSTLNLVRHQIAAYTSALEARLSDLGVKTAPEQEVSTVIRGGASKDQGVRFESVFAATDNVRVIGSFQVDPAHVGQQAFRYLVVYLHGQGFFQYDQAGERIPWDTRLASLQARGESAPLAETLTFAAPVDYNGLADGLAGSRVSVFFAYQLADSGLLVYSATPVSFLIEQAADNDTSLLQLLNR